MKANDTGSNFEDVILDLLKRNLDKRYTSVHVGTYKDYQQYLKQSDKYVEPPDRSQEAHVIRNWPYESMYSNEDKLKKSRTEYVVKCGLDDPIRIECKWQQVDGSVSEKYPYTIMNLYKSPEQIIVFVYEGKGISEGAIKWLKSESQNQFHNLDNQGNRLPKKDIRVMDLAEFITWINDGMRW